MSLSAEAGTNLQSRVKEMHKRLRAGGRLLGLLYMAPAVLLLFLVLVYPLGYSFFQSFLRNDLVGQPEFIGPRNYVRILSDARFWNSLKVTTLFAASTFALQFVIGFGLALMLHEITRGKDLLRTLIVLPLMLSPVVLGLNWRMMLNYDFGIVNYLVGLIGIGPVGWTIRERTALPTLIFVEVWHTTSFVMLILSAGLAAMPEDVLEAAEVDGASWWQRLFWVTIPMLKPVILVVCLFRSYELIRAFDKVFLLTRGGPGVATETLTFYIYRRMFEGFDVGYSSALSWVMFIFTLSISVVLMRSMRLYQEEGK